MERQVFESLPLGLVVFTDDLEPVYRNPASQNLLPDGLSLPEALGRVAFDSRYEDWASLLRCTLDERREKRFEQIVFRTDDAQERLIDMVALPRIDANGNVDGGILILEDITDRAGLEKRLAVSERMAAVGKLAARVAHELNNPLDGILRFLNLGIRAVETGKTERLEDYLQQARGGIMRMAEIVRELVAFSRSSYTAFDDAGINSAIEEALRVLADKADAARVSVVCRLAQDVPAVRGASLFQVFCNLIKNAIDAMADGGTLLVVTELAGSEVIIRIEDTGIGLPEDYERVFEPFFTTKGPDKGTGLGLAICKDIIDKYNGRIVPSRREGGGSVFTIRIPLASCVRQRGAFPALEPVESQSATEQAS